MTLVRDLVATKLGEPFLPGDIGLLFMHSFPEIERASTPLSICRELAISILQNLPESLMDQDTLQKVSLFPRCHVQTYNILFPIDVPPGIRLLGPCSDDGIPHAP